jgi:hypothetical protein
MKALQAFRAAQIAVAKVEPRDLTELALKSVLAVVYEDGPEPGDRHAPIIAQAVATDAVRLAGLLSTVAH